MPEKKKKKSVGVTNVISLAKVLGYYPEAVQVKVKAQMPDYVESVIKRINTVTELKEADDKKGTALIYLSTRNLDHDGDIVTPDGWDLSIYGMNPIGLWSHDAKGDPIFSAVETKADSYGLQQRIEFADTERAQDYWNLVKTGHLRTFSAGFRSMESVFRDEDGFTKLLDRFESDWPEFTHEQRDKVWRVVTKKLLFESSLCNIPCNPFALVQDIEEGDIKICDSVRKALRVDEYIKKGVDSGKLDKKYARKKMKAEPVVKAIEEPEAKVTEKVAGVEEKVTIKEVVTVKEVVTDQDVYDIVQKKIEKSIARRRGAV